MSLPDHKVVKTLVGNAKLRAKLDALEGDRGEFFRVDIGEGVVLDGWCLKPPGFDPAKKYPVLVHVYGEPAAQNVVDRWGGEIYLWHRMLAQRGYVVLSVDNRGTPAPRGRDWRKCVYGKVGILAPRDQAAAMKALEERWPFIDRTRVGIWGWSGGGSMTLDCIFRYPELYQTGIADRLRRRSALLRHDLPGALHGPALRQPRGLQARLADHPRRRPEGEPAADPRHGRRQRPLPELRGAGQSPDRAEQAVLDDGLPQPHPQHQRRRRAPAGTCSS